MKKTPFSIHRIFSVLVKINPVNGSLTGAVTLSVNNLSEIAFDGDGNLYGIAGISQSPLDPGQLEGGTIASIDVITGTVTPEAWATTKGRFRDHCIAFHPEEGLFYHVHWRIRDEMILMETVDPDSGAVTPIGALLTRFQGPKALVYDPGLGEFFLQIENDLYRVTTAGVATPVVQGTDFFSPAGLAIAPDLVDPTVAIRAKLRQQIRAVKKQLKRAQRKQQVARAKQLKKKLRKLRMKLRRL